MINGKDWIIFSWLIALSIATILSGCVSVHRYEREMEWQKSQTWHDNKNLEMKLEKRIEALESRDCKPCEGWSLIPGDQMPRYFNSELFKLPIDTASYRFIPEPMKIPEAKP